MGARKFDHKQLLLKKYVVALNGCWNWIGSLNVWGYGRVQMNGKGMNASRAAYLLLVNPDIGDKCVLHKCDNPRCINPDHLYLGTTKDNTADMVAKGRSCWQTGTVNRNREMLRTGPAADKWGAYGHEIACESCGKMFAKASYDIRRKTHHFCSRPCWRLFQADNR